MKVYHTTRLNNIDNILENGLLRQYRHISDEPKIQKIESIIDKTADRLNIPEKLRRHNVTFAFIPGEIAFTLTNKSICLELEIKPETVYVTDMDIISFIIHYYIVYEREPISPSISDYWNMLIPLDKYLKNNLSYKSPEILIPYDIPLENIDVIDCNKIKKIYYEDLTV